MKRLDGESSMGKSNNKVASRFDFPSTFLRNSFAIEGIEP
jgi:hypothetical protein